MIDERTIEQIIDRADIVEVISQYVPELKQNGHKFKACCPFHGEKTPSFIVSPAKGSWHCFGCGAGGNVVGFVMQHENLNYPEALRLLAKKYGITIEDKELTPEQERLRMKREAMFIINQKCAEHFRANILLKENKSALDYAVNRWGEKYVEEMGIGYAPKSWDDLCTFANKSALSIELMEQMGLVRKRDNGGHYDFYRERVIIPIRDRYRHIIGFTARAMGDEKETAKYLNSPESDIYHKKDSIFGIDVALKQAVKEDKFYLVEGAPDAMQLQRIRKYNTVAPLGGDWTASQFSQLKKYATKVCFLPDADPAKTDRGEKIGAGTRNAMRNGLLAMKEGLAVSIKEIPLAEGGGKQDPDTFCTSLQKFDELGEKDFVTWYAKYIFEDAETTEDRSNAINQICDMIVMVGDEVKETMYMRELQTYYADKTLWRTALNRAKKIAKSKQVIADSKKIDRDLLRKYGFYEDHNAYYALKDGGDESKWSNFIMLPMFHIKDSLLPKRLYRIRNQNKQEEIIEMKQEDLVSLSKFKQKVEGLGNYIWLATEKELTKLKMFLYEQTETALEVTQLGWQRQGFFAYGNGCFDTAWHSADEYGIVRLENGNFYLPGCSTIYKDDIKLFQFERKFIHTNFSNVSLRTYSEQLIKVFGDNAKVGIAFLLASLFRDIIVGQTKSFPIMNLFGPKGSGKSELGHSLMSFFIIKNTPPNIQNATIAALGDAVAQCANALVHIDEYKNSIDLDKREFLKGLWDGTGRSRMNMDRDKKREITSVDCGVILSGQEMPTIDIALFSRLIYLTFMRTEFTAAEKRAFDECKAMRDMGLSHLTLQLLRHRAKMEADFSSNYRQCMTDLNEKLVGETIEDRIQRNWVIPLAAYRTLEAVIDLPFSYRELLKISVDGIIRQNRECKSNNELANFWNVVAYLHQDGEIYIDSDFRIDYLKKFKSNKLKELEWQQPRPVLRLRKDRIFPLYKKFSKQVGDASLPLESLKFYLENSQEYLGVNQSVRFKIIQRGVEVTREEGDGPQRVVKKASATAQALCFDYQQLVENFGINLNVETTDLSEDESDTGSSQPQYDF